MKKKHLLSVLTAVCCVVSIYASSGDSNAVCSHHRNNILGSHIPMTTYTYDLDPLIVVSQNVNEKGLVVMSGQFNKPFTNSNILLSVKYQNAQGEWITGWCKTLYSYNQYNETLKATFELPASTNPNYNLKVELSSDSSTSNFGSVTWDKVVNHYKHSDYTAANCDLDENEYTILLTPRKESTLIMDSNGKVTGVKDRVTSAYSWNKLGNVIMNNKKNNVVFSPKNPATLSDNNGFKSIKMLNQGAISDTLGSTSEVIYDAVAGHPVPYLYTYNDPVYMIAGKFSINGLLLKFSQWPGDPNGPGYHDFRNPNLLKSRYFNLYNTMYEKLSDFMQDQEPIVIVSSQATGLRIYKRNGIYISFSNLTGTSNYGAVFFGYGNDQGGARRGPGSENLIISNTPEMTFYGMGALRNDATTTSQSVRSLSDIESEIAKFTNYVGIFDNVKLDTGSCSNSCFAINNGAQAGIVTDWTKAPNSYIFTGKDDSGNDADGLYIPVKKAYAMWKNGKHMGGSAVPTGAVSADVYWEDVPGLIKSGENYNLVINGSGENAKIEVPINKIKKGNAVICYKVNGVIYWSWHIWVTDDPTNGPTYKSFESLKRKRNDGTVELIPDSDWKWMDRNLGATGSSITSGNWIKNGGLLYQWGRKDPMPPLQYKGNDFYEVAGSVGRVRHPGFIDHTNTAVSQKFNTFYKYVKLSDATVINNIRLSVANPLSLLYVNKDDNSGQAYYKILNTNTDNLNWAVNWFGNITGYNPAKLSELNLWSDNSMGFVSDLNYNDDTNAAPYGNKSSYDPCPNGWRIPSMLIANLGDDIRLDFSPYGIKSNIKLNQLDFIPNSSGSTTGTYLHIIKPNDNSTPSYLKGFKVYSNFGVDMSNIGGNNMGIFPGTGAILRKYQSGNYTDQHHVGLWTSTMLKFADGNLAPAVSAASLFLIPDKGQSNIPDSTMPNITGQFYYNPRSGGITSDAAGCRCIKDPLNIVNEYNFPTQFIYEDSYTEGINNPNSYNVVKAATPTEISIPISKAFSVQSQLLDKKEILNPSNFNNLKVNVLWSDRNGLISNVSLSNPNPSSLADISNTNIIVKVAANQSGNAVVTLHNGSVTNPVFWSWHIWVSNTALTSVNYTTEQPVAEASNYINYVKQGIILSTEIMDRNLGAQDQFPTVMGTPNSTDLAKIKASGGLHYQWGRKDPIPPFFNIGQATYNIFLGNVAADGSVTYPNQVTPSGYNSGYVVESNIYRDSSNANVLISDKISDKISKVLAYSVAKPLVFMKPSTKQIYKGGQTTGTDWLSSEANMAGDRWGRGENKSPFDPCPEGWKIPDVTSTYLANANYGFTPFYKKSVNESAYASVSTTFLGRLFSYSGHWAFIFDNNDYKIGNYPIAGVRGIRPVSTNSNSTINSNVDIGFYKIWMAGLSGGYGRPITMAANVSSKLTQTYEDDADPYFGASCRCVRIKSGDNGDNQGALPKIPVTTNTNGPATITLSTPEIDNMIKYKLIAFPNPVKDLLNLDAKDEKDYYFQIYNMSGQMVKQGKFNNKQTNISELPAGNYLIRINNSESIIKIIKQ